MRTEKKEEKKRQEEKEHKQGSTHQKEKEAKERGTIVWEYEGSNHPISLDDDNDMDNGK